MQTLTRAAATGVGAGSPPADRGAFGAFARFVLLGGGVGLASSAAVPTVASLMPWVVANALVTVASTLLGTELHARFTFGAGQRAQWQQHLQSAGSAVAAYLATSAAVLVLHVAEPSAGMRWEQAVYLGASGVAGIGRFLVLRLLVFARRTTDLGSDDARAVRVGAHPGRRGPDRRRLRRKRRTAALTRRNTRAVAVRRPGRARPRSRPGIDRRLWI